MSARPHLYINSKGYYVTRHSYSGSERFHDCPRRYYLERVQGWHERERGAAREFGTVVEHAWTFWHQTGQDTQQALAEFCRLWNPFKDQNLSYSKTDVDWNRLYLTGQELIRLYALRFPQMPFTVEHPEHDFQVETNVEVFPGSKLQGIEFTSFIDCMGKLKSNGEDVIIDSKVSGKAVPELTALDPQLRSYSWVKGRRNVAFLWWQKMGRTISRGDSVTLLEAAQGYPAGMDAFVLASDAFGVWVTPVEEALSGMANFVGESKATKAARQIYVEENSVFMQETAVTKQRITFKMALVSAVSAEDIGRSIKQDIINIASATEKDFFPMVSGVRYPHEQCVKCPMRGICAGDADLRDRLVERKDLLDETFLHDQDE